MASQIQSFRVDPEAAEICEQCWDTHSYLCIGGTWEHAQREHYRLVGLYANTRLSKLEKWPKLLNAAEQMMETVEEEQLPELKAQRLKAMKERHVTMAPLMGFFEGCDDMCGQDS